jgi:hypothetical protein
MQNIKNITTTVFKMSNNKEGAIYPPEQVFWKQDFLYLLTKGGYIVNDEVEYQKLMDCLRKIGGKEFSILENFGTQVTDREIPFYAKISISSSLSDFDNIIKQFDPVFGLMPYHFFIYGQNDSWGIYLCEYPTINIIGCRESLVQDFSKVFNIKGNGFEDEKDFIGKEYENYPEILQKLIILCAD